MPNGVVVCSPCELSPTPSRIPLLWLPCSRTEYMPFQIDCSQTRSSLEPLARDVETFLTSPELPRGTVSTHDHNQYEQVTLARQRWLEDVLPRLDMSIWRKNVKERKSRGFSDLLPGY